MNIFCADYLNHLSSKARVSQRLRQHDNVHHSYQDSCQRLFNAIEPGSYIRPHRHYSDPRDEMLIAVRGQMTLILFDDMGTISDIIRFGIGTGMAVGAQITSTDWHTVVALESGSILLEMKAGPFDPNLPKDLAFWAPEDGSESADSYLEKIYKLIDSIHLRENPLAFHRHPIFSGCSHGEESGKLL